MEADAAACTLTTSRQCAENIERASAHIQGQSQVASLTQTAGAQQGCAMQCFVLTWAAARLHW